MSVWRGPGPLVLASNSSARQTLLRNAGFDFDALPAPIDERAIEATLDGAAGDQVAKTLAEAKALAVGARYPGRIVIGADQTLTLESDRFHKPSGRKEAAAQLAALAGRTHTLHSAAAVIQGGHTLACMAAAARLTMRPLSADQIESYLDAAGDAVTGSVGGYQLERLGIHLFERIDGDHFTILGLPLLPLLAFFRRAGWLTIGETTA